MSRAQGVSQEISQLHSSLLAKIDQLVLENNKILQKPLSECFVNALSNRMAAEELKAAGIIEKLAEATKQLANMENQYPQLKKVSPSRRIYDEGDML